MKNPPKPVGPLHRPARISKTPPPMNPQPRPARISSPQRKRPRRPR